MRHTTLERMFEKYHEVRVGLGSARTSMPDSDRAGMDVQDRSEQKSKDTGDNKRAFVADIKKYLKSMNWCDRYVLMCQMRPNCIDEKVWEWIDIIKLIRKKSGGRKIEYYYLRADRMADRYWDRIRPAAQDYFRRVGYLK